MKFGSWTYEMLKVDLRPLSALGAGAAERDSAYAAVNVANFSASVEFDLLAASGRRNEKSYPCCPNERYVDISYNFTLRRKTLFYTVNLVRFQRIICINYQVIQELYYTYCQFSYCIFTSLFADHPVRLPLTAFGVRLLLAGRQVHT